MRNGARFRAVPPPARDVLDQLALDEAHRVDLLGRASSDWGFLSWNQKNPRGASVNRYGKSPMAGKRVRPNISSGTISAYSERSSWTAWAERARLCTQRTTSS